MTQARIVLGPDEIARALTRIAHEILEANHGSDDLVLLGIPTRGVHLAERLAARLSDITGEDFTARTGALDITMHRDDLRDRPTLASQPTRIPAGGIDDRVVVLVDDVLYSGRTIRAALDALAELLARARHAVVPAAAGDRAPQARRDRRAAAPVRRAAPACRAARHGPLHRARPQV